jgi:hypothetical protein
MSFAKIKDVYNKFFICIYTCSTSRFLNTKQRMKLKNLEMKFRFFGSFILLIKHNFP